mgnify:CR=1 FL=1
MIENTAYIVLSRQTAMRRQLDVIANNIANSGTTAFKSEEVLFDEYLVDGDQTRSKISFVTDIGTARNLQAGEFTRTENPLDLAIRGRGYLTVETPDGERYTRNGSLRIDSEGYLSTSYGYKVLDQDGRAIELDPTDPQLTVARDGTITGGQGAIGRLAVVTFENEQNLQQTGSGLYRTDDRPEQAEDVNIEQGMLENSNVEPILEMTRMIELSRNYQSTNSMISREDEMRRRGIERLGSVS